MDNLPIIIVAPTKKEALAGLRKLNLPYHQDQDFVLIGNGSAKQIEGLRAEKFHTFFIDPERVSYRIIQALRFAWAKMPVEKE